MNVALSVGPFFLLLVVLVALVVLAASPMLRRPRVTTADPADSETAASGVGRVAYEVTVGVTALLVSGCLLLAALWVLAVGLLGAGLVVYGGPPAWIPAVIIAALLAVIGLRLGYLARRRLLQI